MAINRSAPVDLITSSAAEDTPLDVTFEYGPRDGKLVCALTVGAASIVHPVGGWHDGLRELIIAASEMLGQTSEATAAFQEEPGEFRWRLCRLAANRIQVRVIEFGDWATGQPDGVGRLIFDVPCGAVAFARAVYEGSSDRQGTSERDGLARLLRRYDYS